MMTLDRPQLSPGLKHPAPGRVLNRLVGVGFAAAAVGNAVWTLLQASSFLQWHFHQLDAPLKGFYTFKRSAHCPVLEEAEKARSILRQDVLAGSTALADAT